LEEQNKKKELTVALGERSLDPAGRRQSQCFGHVELDPIISTPCKCLAEAGDLLHQNPAQSSGS